MKKFIPIIAIAALLITAIVFATVDSRGLVPSALADSTQSIVESVKSDTDDIYKDIQANINSMTALKVRMETAKANGSPLSPKEFAAEIEKITKSYETLASQRDNIENRLLSKISKISDLQKNVSREIDTLNERKGVYTTKLQEISSNSDPEIIRTRQKSLNKSIEYINREIDLWVQFSNIEKDIERELLSTQVRIDSFLSMIESSAILYREGLNLLELQQNISDALSIFTTDAAQMNQLNQGMEASWDELDYLVNSLTSLTSITIKQEPAK